MKTYYVKTRGNIYHHFENYTIWKVKIKYNKSKSNQISAFVYDTNLEDVPEYVNGMKVLTEQELDEIIHDEDRLKY